MINMQETYQGHSQQKVVEQALTALYAPPGIEPKMVYYPSKRGLQLVDQGEIDAEAGRFEVTAQSYPNLLIVNKGL